MFSKIHSNLYGWLHHTPTYRRLSNFSEVKHRFDLFFFKLQFWQLLFDTCCIKNDAVGNCFPTAHTELSSTIQWQPAEAHVTACQFKIHLLYESFHIPQKNTIAGATSALTFHIIWSENRLNFPNPKEELQPAFPPGCTDSTASEADRQGSADRQNPSVPDRLWFPLWC